jgi:hypothetical protein
VRSTLSLSDNPAEAQSPRGFLFFLVDTDHSKRP